MGDQMFMGEFNHTVDTKGRTMVPSKLRDQLGSTLFVTKGLDGCITLYTQEEFEKLQEKISSLSMMNKSARTLRRLFIGSAQEIEIDKQGRILLPTPLREYAGISKDIVFVGNKDYIEIWDKQRWNEENDIDAEAAAQEIYRNGISL